MNWEEQHGHVLWHLERLLRVKKYITFRKKNYRNHEIDENARETLPRWFPLDSVYRARGTYRRKKITCSAFEISLPPKDAIGNGTKLVQNADIIFLEV